MRQYVVRSGDFFLVDLEERPNFSNGVIVGQSANTFIVTEMSTDPDDAHLYDKAEFAIHDASKIPGAVVQIIEREIKYINFPEGDGTNE